MAVVSPTSDIDFVRKCAPDAVLHRPFTGQAVLLSLIMAHAQFTYGSRLRQKIAKLDETMRTIRNVERAKAILMANRALREGGRLSVHQDSGDEPPRFNRHPGVSYC